MTTDRDLTLSAFVDGEAVDAVELAAALASPGARETLLEFVELRLQAQAAPDRPGDLFQERMRRALRRAHSRPTRLRRLWLGVGAAAAVVVATLAIQVAKPAPPRPKPSRGSPSEVGRVLRFERGVDWHALPAEEGR